MRISDWSSDVCSSDLDAHGLVHRGHEEQCDMRRAEKLEILHDSEVAMFSGVARDSRRLVIGCSLLLPALGVNAVGAVEIERKIPREVLLARRFQKCGAQLVEIGRASCRERVCQYV